MATKEDLRQQNKLAAERDLAVFIQLVTSGKRLLGSIHREVIRWWERSEAKPHQLLLLPRDHMKSALVAYRVAWRITRDPTIRVLYLSSTANLAIKQLKFIKDILTCDAYRYYWPDMVNIEESKREKWTETEMSVDHPRRKSEAIRDPTIFTGGLTTTLTGMHCDIAVLDDVVVHENAYTEDGREKVRSQYSLLSSIEGAEAEEWIVGTRYHPKDLYDDILNMKMELYDTSGEVDSEEEIYEVYQAQVETNGEFLWPRQQRSDGKWFGFDDKILSVKRNKYLDKIQFRAQYYNDPNDAASAAINRDYFQYFDRGKLKRQDGKWFYNGKRLNIFASVDFAFSTRAKADYTAIVVVGVDSTNNYFVLDIDRFRSDLVSEYFNRILALHQKWDFRKLRAEVTSAQQVIVKDIKENYIKRHGLALAIEDHKPTRYDGAKEERIEAALQPRYANRMMWHYEGGHCQTLEEELVLQNPPHDDIKDALAACIGICVAPTAERYTQSNSYMEQMKRVSHNEFGGVSF